MLSRFSHQRRNAVTRDVAEHTAQLAVFLDPSGRRWRRVRLLLILVLGLLVAGGFWVVPRLNAPVALQGRHAVTVTSAQTGAHPPVVGDGPLVRVVKVVPAGAALEGVDPFTGNRVGLLPGADATKARQAIADGKPPYVIQRFGYSATARRTLSLTFDDGPDPVYTPKLLNVLARNHVPATFFVTGRMAAKNPQLVSREIREGHAVGNHSLTHVDVSTAPGWRTREELVVTDHVLGAITGHYSSYFRLPYEGNDEESTQATLNLLLRAQQWGYLVVSHDFDTEDWDYALHPHGPNIPLPPLDGRNLTVLMHDGGGSGRQATIDYVARLIPAARKAGYVFQTMPQVQPWMQDATGKITPSVWDRIDLLTVKALYAWPNAALRAMFLYALVAVVGLGVLNAGLALWRRWRSRRPLVETRHPSVSVLIAAYNEEAVIRRTVERILRSHYPHRASPRRRRRFARPHRGDRRWPRGGRTKGPSRQPAEPWEVERAQPRSDRADQRDSRDIGRGHGVSPGHRDQPRASILRQ